MLSMRISKQTAKNILRDAGAVRVGDDAAEELTDAVNTYAYRIAQKAVKLAAHAKRETIKKSDVELAL